MTELLTWLLSIMLKTTFVVIGFVCIKQLIRNGGGVLADMLKTAMLGIRYGCAKLRKVWTDKLLEGAKKEEEEVTDSDGPEVRVEGTVR